MAAAPEARSWALLPDALVREVFSRVPRLLDRHNAFRACPQWEKALRRKAPPALPSLLFPAPTRYEYDGSPRLFCILSGAVDQGQDYPAVIRRGARCFGSHDGGWLFLAIRDPHGHKLVNIRTGASLDLPANIKLDLSPLKAYIESSSWDGPMITVHAAALSAAPDDASCVAVCIVREPRVRCVARFRIGEQCAIEIRPPEAVPNFVDAEDLVYHNDAFHLLLSGGYDVLVCKPQLLPDNRTAEAWEKRSFFHPGRRDYDERVRGRYLVSSRGDLLLVVRFAPGTTTSKFKVFRATERVHPMPEEVDPRFPVDNYPWAWSELDSLDGRILFVGYGCSRSYELKDAEGQIQHKGFKPGVYFFDNQEFYFLDAEQYMCSDNGRWSEPGGVQRCFPSADLSWNSPPAWVLP